MTTPVQRYEVIERLDAGGMAEVFRGKAVSIEGFEKQVAIKRVLPHLAKNQKFVNMFLDEARLSLFLDHANIVSVFDLGRAGDTYFIVMEYIDGPNLKKLLEHARQRRLRVSTELVAYLGVEICRGLDYAHNRVDAAGRRLGIVHRDISPPNILVSRQGEVKITDFGLAKAQSQLEVTDPGVVKGKFGYLSPEAAFGEEVDHRTDIFAVGIVLWELIANRRLFQGQSDMDTLQIVRKAEVPSLRTINPAVPVMLDEIILKALARDPRQRLQSARELGALLSKFLFSNGTAVSSYDLADFVSAMDDKFAPQQTVADKQMSTVIQDEINRLILIDSREPNGTPPKVAEVAPPAAPGTNLEDPRTWGDIGFDADVRMSGSFYAAGAAGAAPQQAGLQPAPAPAATATRLMPPAAPAVRATAPETPVPGATQHTPPPRFVPPPIPSHSSPNQLPGQAPATGNGVGTVPASAPGIPDASTLRGSARPMPRRKQMDEREVKRQKAEQQGKMVFYAIIFLVLSVGGFFLFQYASQ